MTYTLAPPLPPSDTPSDYARIHFDPIEMPAKRIVGMLACQRDPLLRTFTTTVHATRPAAAPPLAQKGRALKKKGAAPTPAETPSGAATPVGKLWEVELLDTIVFPEGGGQPWDTGKLHVTDANGARQSFVIESCIRRKLDAVHIVRVPDDSPIAFDGLTGTEVDLEVDWDRRLDHMVTHTAQHLLSAVLDSKGLPTLSWAMGAYPTLEAPYVELPRGLTWAEAEEAEQKCNELIREARKVWIDVTVQGDGVSDPERASELERENRVIPKDYEGGVIRHCNIDGIDRNACCGTQCPHLGLCGFIHVLPPSTPAGSSKPSSTAPTRLFFVAGRRAVDHLAVASRALSQAGQAVNVGRGDVAERVARVEILRSEAAERERAVKAELAKMIGEQAAANSKSVVWINRAEKSTHDFDFLSAIAMSYQQANAGVIILTSTPANIVPALLLVQSRDGEKAKSLYEQVKATLAGDDKTRVKGGGARGRFMAKVEGRWGNLENAQVMEVVDALAP